MVGSRGATTGRQRLGKYGTTNVFSMVLRLYRTSLGVKFSKGAHPLYGRGFGFYCAK